MSRYSLFFLCLVSFLCLGTSLAAPTPNPVPVAWIYVTSNFGYPGNLTRIVGYAADSGGRLTQLPGSPFPDTDVNSMAVNGKYLFAVGNKSATHIYTYLMKFNGSLKQVASTDVQKFPGSNCASWGPLVLDHTGATLYPFTFNADCSGTDDAYQSLNIVKSSGALKYLSETFPNQEELYPLTFIGNNVYAYEASCNEAMFRNISGFKRENDGSLVNISINVPYPVPPTNGYYCPGFASADRTNHLAIDMALTSEPGGPGLGYTAEDQIATYTVDESNGNLMGTNTDRDMPHTAVYTVKTMDMAPSGKLLAVGGTKGLQIFHFNGAEPATVDTGLLTTVEIDQIFWDNHNHVYAIGTKAGKLFVFTVTPTGAQEAQGSPYTITQPLSLIVQPK